MVFINGPEFCSNALPFNLVHFPKGEYPGKLTQREIISEEELSEQLDCLSEKQRARIKLQKTIKDDSFNAQPIRKSRVTEQLS